MEEQVDKQTDLLKALLEVCLRQESHSKAMRAELGRVKEELQEVKKECQAIKDGIERH